MKSSFKNTPKALRDLQYLLDGNWLLDSDFSGNLVDDNFFSNLRNDFRDHLQTLEQDSFFLEESLNDVPLHVIGKYAESLMLYFLNNHPHIDLILHNYQIIEAGKTLGEVDFIFEHMPSQQVFHWEMAYKFYLQYKDEWIGPNAKDRLALKLEKVQQQQLPLVQHSSIQNLVKQPIQSQFFIKGYLFKAFEENTDSDDAIWVHHKNLQQLEGRNDYWCILPNPYWFSPVLLLPKELEIVRWPEIRKKVQILMLKRPQAYLLTKLEKRRGSYYEKQRCFVVPDSWPKQL